MALSIWAVMLVLGALTYLTRLSFISLHNRWEPPAGFRRALHYVPVAVLTAILVPELLMAHGAINASPLNPRLIGGAVAIFIAWRTKNTVLTIVIGMAVFWLVQYLALR